MLIFSFLISSLFACAGVGGGAAGGTAPEITGVWTVTMRYQDGSCPDTTGGTKASMWTVNQDGQGAYDAKVQGDDDYPSLFGKADGAAVVLTGLKGSHSTQWRLTGNSSSLTGRALQTREAKDAYKKKIDGWGGPREVTSDAYCVVIWTVDATKQGK